MPSMTVDEINIFEKTVKPQFGNHVLQKYPTNDIDLPVAGYPYTGWSATNSPHTQLLTAPLANSYVDFNSSIVEGIQYSSPVSIKRVEIIADIDPVDYVSVNLLMGDSQNTTISLLDIAKNTVNGRYSGYYKKEHMFWIEFPTELISTYGILLQVIGTPQHTVRVYQIRPYMLISEGVPTGTYQNPVGGEPHNLITKLPYGFSDTLDNQSVQYTTLPDHIHNGANDTATVIDTGMDGQPKAQIEFGRLIHLTRVVVKIAASHPDTSNSLYIFSQSNPNYTNRAIEWQKVGELLNTDLRNAAWTFVIGTRQQPVWSRRIRIITDNTLGEVG